MIRSGPSLAPLWACAGLLGPPSVALNGDGLVRRATHRKFEGMVKANNHAEFKVLSVRKFATTSLCGPGDSLWTGLLHYVLPASHF
jgi:hypothetical protein